MNSKLQQFFENIIPFFMLGISIALVVGLFILFSYVLVWGLLIGAVLWAISAIKSYFFTSNTTQKKAMHMKGRIIEHEDKD